MPLFNGALECEFRRYQLFDGKFREFRSDGGEVKSEEEKRIMAQKNRFKKHREFKQRLEETQENEAKDIRSFILHPFSHQSFEKKKEEKHRKERSTEERKPRPFAKSGYRNDRNAKLDNRKFDRKPHNEQRKTRRNNHED